VAINLYPSKKHLLLQRTFHYQAPIVVKGNSKSLPNPFRQYHRKRENYVTKVLFASPHTVIEGI
jgi:hypothetical protein